MTRGLCLLTALLFAGCVTALPTSDLLVHSREARLDGSTTLRGDRFSLHFQTNSVSHQAIAAYAERTLRRRSEDEFHWERADVVGGGAGFSRLVAGDRVAIGATVGPFLAGGDVTFALPRDFFLTSSYALWNQGYLLLQRRLWDRRSLSLAAGGFYRRERFHLEAKYKERQRSFPDCHGLICSEWPSDDESFNDNQFGARVSALVPLRSPRGAPVVFTRFVLESAYSPTLEDYVVTGGIVLLLP